MFSVATTYLHDAYNPSRVAEVLSCIAPYFNEDGTPTSPLPNISGLLETAASHFTYTSPGNTLQAQRLHYLGMNEMFVSIPLTAAMMRASNAINEASAAQALWGGSLEHLASIVRWSAEMQDDIMNYTKVRLPSWPSWKQQPTSGMMPLAYCGTITESLALLGPSGTSLMASGIGLTEYHREA